MMLSNPWRILGCNKYCCAVQVQSQRGAPPAVTPAGQSAISMLEGIEKHMRASFPRSAERAEAAPRRGQGSLEAQPSRMGMGAKKFSTDEVLQMFARAKQDYLPGTKEREEVDR